MEILSSLFRLTATPALVEAREARVGGPALEPAAAETGVARISAPWKGEAELPACSPEACSAVPAARQAEGPASKAQPASWFSAGTAGAAAPFVFQASAASGRRRKAPEDRILR